MLGVGQTPSPIRLGRNLIVPETAFGQVSLDIPYDSRLGSDVGMTDASRQGDIGKSLEYRRSITRHRTTRSVKPTEVQPLHPVRVGLLFIGSSVDLE